MSLVTLYLLIGALLCVYICATSDEYKKSNEFEDYALLFVATIVWAVLWPLYLIIMTIDYVITKNIER